MAKMLVLVITLIITEPQPKPLVSTHQEFIREVPVVKEYEEYDVKGGDFKSYMSYRKITCKSSKQYKLIDSYKISSKGLCTYQGRISIALGTYFKASVGTKVDLIMKSGKVVKCVVGDIKRDCDTINGVYQKYDKSIVEVLVCTNKLNAKDKRSGNIESHGLKGQISKILVYSKCDN